MDKALLVIQGGVAAPAIVADRLDLELAKLGVGQLDFEVGAGGAGRHSNNQQGYSADATHSGNDR